MDKLQIADQLFSSRLFLGTGKFSSSAELIAAVTSAKTEMVTLALKRIDLEQNTDDILQPLQSCGVRLLPNTSGASNAREAILAAQLAREMLTTNWIKLEIHPDHRYLMPDPIETLTAAKVLCEQGFNVLPYVHADPVLCKRLEEVGCAAVMPLASPIGSNQGIKTDAFLRIIIEQACVPVIVDAGLGSPSDAVKVMEMGADAVLINTAIASSQQPAKMAQCFQQAVACGRNAYKAGLGRVHSEAQSSSPLTGFLQQLNG